MQKRIFLFLSLIAIFIMASSNSCNEKSTNKVASKEIQNEATTANTGVSSIVQKTEETTSKTPMPKRDITNLTKFEITTSMGTMKGVLYDNTPLHRDNFIKLAKEGFYKDLLFHRVIDQFMIQGGDPNSKGAEPGKRLGNGGPGYTVPAEFNAANIHKKGALAAARRGGPSNPQKASSGSQFYIVEGKKLSDNEINQVETRINKMKLLPEPFSYTEEQKELYRTVGGTAMLDMDYTVYGEITEGFDVLENISNVQKGTADRPSEDVTMDIKIIE